MSFYILLKNSAYSLSCKHLLNNELLNVLAPWLESKQEVKVTHKSMLSAMKIREANGSENRGDDTPIKRGGLLTARKSLPEADHLNEGLKKSTKHHQDKETGTVDDKEAIHNPNQEHVQHQLDEAWGYVKSVGHVRNSHYFTKQKDK